MMKKNNLLVVMMLILFSLGMVSCSDDDDDVQLKAIEKEVTLDATAFDKWVYFSFETGKEVGTTGVEEKKNGLDWDIAFHRYDVRFNCGTSGSGKGGALKSESNMAKAGWDALTEAPTSGYKVDETINVYKVYAHQNSVKVDVPGSKVVTGTLGKGGTWVNFTATSSGPSYVPTNQIFVVKTADGKYVKIWLKSYTKLVGGSKKGGHITMKYAYQKDGSRNF